MQQERPIEEQPTGPVESSSPQDDGLQRHRDTIAEMLHASDAVFDTINSLQAQQYLQQNLQSGGQ